MASISRFIAVSLAAFLIFFGCTGVSEGDNCTGETHITINGITKVCVDGKLSGSCTLDGVVYSESSDSKIICENGIWVSKEKSVVTKNPASNGSGMEDDTGAPPMNGTGGTDAPECQGESFFTANGVTEACVGGKMTKTCSSEGEVYSESEFLNSRVVCEGGIWVDKVIVPKDAKSVEPGVVSGADKPCIGISSTTINGVTTVCINGARVSECTTEGEVYWESEFLKSKVFCEGGKWVTKTLE